MSAGLARERAAFALRVGGHRRRTGAWCRRWTCTHIEWRSAGGSNHIENLICPCEAHHLALHEGTLGIIGPASTAVIERVGSNAFTRAERAVHTAQALKNLGYRPNEVRKAVERTKTHVGSEDRTLEQWITIALRYCGGGTPVLTPGG